MGGNGRDRFQLQRGGRAIVLDFQSGEDRLVLPEGMTFGAIEVVKKGQSCLIQVPGQVLAQVNQVQTLQTSDFL
jgi:hypothetical protein